MTKLPRQPHGILAIAYVLSRWGETSWGALQESASIAGVNHLECEKAVAKLIELGNVKAENGRLVWIGEPYSCD